MNGKERVLAVFGFEEPDRVPLWCGASPEFINKAMRELELRDEEAVSQRFHDDFRRVYTSYCGPDSFSPAKNLKEGMTYRTPFGIERYGIGYGQPHSHPLESATLKEVHDYPWPDPDWMDVSSIGEEAKKYSDEYGILGGDWSPFWHDAIDLLGMENLYYKMYDEPEVVEAILGHIVEYYAKVTERIFEEASDVIDIYFIGNDFGSQNGPLLGEGLFRRFIQPHLERLAALGHNYGLYVMLHCCGGFKELIPLMIEAGVDALQSLQPSARGMDPRCLKEKYGGQIVFNGCIDTQHVLINGNPEFVKEKTKEILEIMMPGSGFILSPSHDYLLEETPLENVLAMYDTVIEEGYYTT